jgi:hypothetical protein
MDQLGTTMARLAPADAAADDGAAVVNAVADRIRAEFLTRIGLGDLLRPHAPTAR